MKIVVLPGLDGTGRLLAPFGRALPPELELVAMSYPPDQKLSYEELRAFVASRLPAEGDFVLVGESFSGPLALRLAAAQPRGLLGVVLVGTFLRRPVSSWVRALVFDLPLPGVLIRRLLAGPSAPQSLVENIQHVLKSVRPAVLAHRLREALSVDARKELADCPVPVLWISGKQDTLLGDAHAARLRDIRPGLRVKIIDAPHLILERAPDASARAIAEFVDDLRSR